MKRLDHVRTLLTVARLASAAPVPYVVQVSGAQTSPVTISIEPKG